MDLFFIFLTVFIIQFIITVEMNLLGPLAPYLAQYFNIGESLVIRFNLGFSIAGLLIPIIGAWADKYGKKKSIVFSLIFFILGTIVSGFTKNPLIFALGRTLIGIGYFSLSASNLSYISDFIPYEKRGKASGILRIAFGLAILVSPIYASYMTKTYNNLSTVYLPLTIAGITCLILLFRLPEGKKGNLEKVSIKNITSLLKNKTSFKLLLIIFLIISAPTLIYNYLGFWLKNNFKLNQMEIGYTFTFASFGTIVGTTVAALLSDKIGKEKFSKVFYSIMTLAVLPIPYIKSVTILSFFTFLFSMGLDGGFTSYQTLCSEIYPEQRTTFMTLFYFTNSLGITLISLLGPIIYEYGGYKLVASIAAISTIIAIMIFHNMSVEGTIINNNKN